MDVAQRVAVAECRACLQKIDVNVCQNLFQEWCTTWAVPGTTVADFMSKFADIEITEHDTHSNVVCPDCYRRLADACSFMKTVQRNDTILRKRCDNTATANTNLDTSTWGNPTFQDKNLNDNYDNTNSVEIKQENFSEHEDESNLMDQDWEPTMDIKIEPEEFVAPVQLNIKVNEPCSLKGLKEPLQLNGTNIYYEEAEYLEETVKSEPQIKEETTLELSLECMLCTEMFCNVNDLKAHVMSKHSYQSVKRKSDDRPRLRSSRLVKKDNNEVSCSTCRQDLHKTRHYICATCGSKFLEHHELSQHRLVCQNRRKYNPKKSSLKPQLSLPNKDSFDEQKTVKTKKHPANNLPSSPENKVAPKAIKRNKHKINTEDKLHLNIPESELPNSNCIENQNYTSSEPSPSGLAAVEIKETFHIMDSVDSSDSEDTLSIKSLDSKSTNIEDDGNLLPVQVQPNLSSIQEEHNIIDIKEETNSSMAEESDLDNGQELNLAIEQDPILVTEQEENMETNQEPNLVTEQEENMEIKQEPNFVTEQELNPVTGQDFQLSIEQESNLLTDEKEASLVIGQDEQNMALLQKLDYENSSDNEEATKPKAPDETIPNGSELSQSMKVHLAMNPMADDTLVLEDKMDVVESDKSDVRYNLKLVDISELTDKNVSQ